MSANPEKIQLFGVTEIGDEKALALQFVQAPNSFSHGDVSFL
jgi:hypothetical protein